MNAVVAPTLVFVSASATIHLPAATPSLGLLEPRGKQTDQGNARQDTQQAASRAGYRYVASQIIKAAGVRVSLHQWCVTGSVDGMSLVLELASGHYRKNRSLTIGHSSWYVIRRRSWGNGPHPQPATQRVPSPSSRERGLFALPSVLPSLRSEGPGTSVALGMSGVRGETGGGLLSDARRPSIQDAADTIRGPGFATSCRSRPGGDRWRTA
jgi:hypothetical protein